MEECRYARLKEIIASVFKVYKGTFTKVLNISLLTIRYLFNVNQMLFTEMAQKFGKFTNTSLQL